VKTAKQLIGTRSKKVTSNQKKRGKDSEPYMFVSDELQWLIRFMVNSFVRPSDIKNLQHQHVTVGSASATQDAAVRDFRIFGGYKVNENIDLELGYMQTSNFGMNVSGRSGGGVNYAMSVSAKYSGVDYTAVVRPSVDSGYNNLFARIGFTNYKGEATGSVSASGNTYTSNGSVSGSGNIYGFGYDAPLNTNMSVRMSVNRLTKIAGESDTSATIYSIGLVNRF
jgi:hypothetical protein